MMPVSTRRGMLIVVSAPSGAGKTTLCRELRQRLGNLAYSVSYTTRAPRPGETDGQAYHFVPEGAFQQMVDRGEFAEWARVHGHLYGTAARTLESVLDRGQDILLDIDTQGARQLRARYPLGLFVFVVAPSMQDLEVRLRERKSDAPREIARRMARAVDEIAAWREYDYVVVNHHLAAAVQQLACIVEAERCRTSRLTLNLPDLPADGGVQATLPGGGL
jgi:guanylate kinase